MVTDRRHQQAFNPVRKQILDIFALKSEIAFAVAQKNAVAGPPRRGFGTPHHRPEERIDHIGNDQADGLGLLRDEPARDAVRHIVERGDRLLDLALCFGVDAVTAVDDPRRRHRRNAGTFGDIVQGHWPMLISC